MFDSFRMHVRDYQKLEKYSRYHIILIEYMLGEGEGGGAFSEQGMLEYTVLSMPPFPPCSTMIRTVFDHQMYAWNV